MKPVSISVFAILLATTLAAQTPLTAIDWLGQPVPVPIAEPLAPQLNEPPVTNGVVIPQVDVLPLGAASPDAVGLLPTSTTGLPKDLWYPSRTDDLTRLLADHSNEPIPAVQALYYTLLMAEADAPSDAPADGKFLKVRTKILMDFGAVEPALALIERAGPSTEHLFDQWLDLALLNGSEDAPCQNLRADPSLSQSYAARIYCTARAGDWQTAALTYETAAALGALTPIEVTLLAQFLDPETISDTPSTVPSPSLTPLLFRLFEAIGSPLPTRGLPRAYAIADLRKTTGWKSEIEAAERLTHTGALPATRLLGLYTERTPAASGGVWDRVASIQALDDALSESSGEAVSETLSDAFEAFRSQGLEVAFAQLFSQRLQDADLSTNAQHQLFEIALLSPDYEAAMTTLTAKTPRQKFLADIARGTPTADAAHSGLEQAIATAFSSTKASPKHQALLDQGKLGQAILAAANQLDRAGSSDTGAISDALATFRAVGLEDTARRAALQLLILKETR